MEIKNEIVKNNKDIISDVVVAGNWFLEGYEINHGAHYYAYSPYITGYTKITGNIELPNSLHTSKGKRNAYISFGVVGLYGSIDMGIMNSGEGWKPFYFDVKNKKFFSFKDFTVKDAINVVIQIDVSPNRKALFSLQFKGENSCLLKYFLTEVDASHILVYENSKVKNRFYRFASLVPVGKDNQNDGTYMIDGKFKDLKIVKDNEEQNWGIDSDNIDVSWLVSSRRITFKHKNDNENFSIIHKQKNI